MYLVQPYATQRMLLVCFALSLLRLHVHCCSDVLDGGADILAADARISHQHFAAHGSV
jgi:hypothetical protein